MQNAADKFLEKMQELFAEELEILIAKRGEEKQIDLPQTNEEIVLAEAEKVVLIHMDCLVFLVLEAAAVEEEDVSLQLEVVQPPD